MTSTHEWETNKTNNKQNKKQYKKRKQNHKLNQVRTIPKPNTIKQFINKSASTSKPKEKTIHAHGGYFFVLGQTCRIKQY